MTEKILCPWCGAEMNDRWYKNELGRFGNYVCDDCWAESPEVVWPEGMPKSEWDALNKAAALRRYTPILKPMTLEEVIAFDGEIWMEDKSDFDVWACRCFFNRAEKKMTVHYITMNTEVLEFSTYGKTWRCWSRKPTDEERSAAGWET